MAVFLLHLEHPVMKQSIASCSYQAYLEAVLEEKDSFHEIGDIMTRHATLAATNKELQLQQFRAAERMDLIR